MESRLQKAQETIKKYIENDEKSLNNLEIQRNYKIEIENLNNVMIEIKSKYTTEINEVKKQRDNALEKIEGLEEQIKKLKLTLKTTHTLQDQHSKILKERMDVAK